MGGAFKPRFNLDVVLMHTKRCCRVMIYTVTGVEVSHYKSVSFIFQKDINLTTDNNSSRKSMTNPSEIVTPQSGVMGGRSDKGQQG